MNLQRRMEVYHIAHHTCLSSCLLVMLSLSSSSVSSIFAYITSLTLWRQFDLSSLCLLYLPDHCFSCQPRMLSSPYRDSLLYLFLHFGIVSSGHRSTLLQVRFFSTVSVSVALRCALTLSFSLPSILSCSSKCNVWPIFSFLRFISAS